MTAIARALSEEGERILVIDTKIEPRYRGLPRSRIIADVSQAWEPETRYESREGPTVYIWRPAIETVQDPEKLDEALLALYHRYRHVIVIDELYPLHTAGRAGPGLTALLTRGRSRGITTVMGSQRPAWVSRFCLSETQHYWIYPLVDKQDRRRLSEVVPDMPVESLIPRYHFLYYCNSAEMEAPILFSPLKLLKGDSAGDESAYKINELQWI